MNNSTTATAQTLAILSLHETQELTAKDLERLAHSDITTELAERAGIRRVDRITGAEIVGRTPRASEDYAGLVFPYVWPGETRPREYRLRRDHPDLEQQADGTTKVKAKYLSPPGKGNLLYFAPETSSASLADARIPAVITEGEKKTLALSRYFAERNEPRLVIGLSGVWNWRGSIGKETNADGQAQKVKGIISDFERIEWRKREVEIVFDANVATNESVKAARHELAKALIARGASVRLINLPDEGEGINGIDDLLFAKGADFVTELFERERSQALRRDVQTRAGNVAFQVNEKGVYAIDVETGDKTWVCAPLYIEAKTRDGDSDNWGRLLRFKDDDGRGHQCVLSNATLHGERTAVLQLLSSKGLSISPGRKGRECLDLYLHTTKVENRLLCVSKVGWFDGMYVFPDETIGGKDREGVYLQDGVPNPLLQAASTLEDWQETISKFCVNNSRLVFAVSLAFASPLLYFTGEESGGFHYKGESTEGKTTALLVAGSVWGGGAMNGFLDTWLTTVNSLEAIAEQHNDGLLCLDEIGQAKAEDVGKTAYLLANGQGKNRMQRTLALNPNKRWRVLFLSSGEKTLAEMIEAAGQKLKAGQEVRFVTLKAKASEDYGLFEDLHGFKSSKAFAEHFRDCARQSYGTPIRAFLKQLADNPTDIKKDAKAFVEIFLNRHVPKNAHAQVGRIATRFALVAYAGERATEMGITGWKSGDATDASLMLFGAYLDERGAQGSSEDDASIRQVRAFLSTHGASRFQVLNGQPLNGDRIINRAGIKTINEQNETVEYCIFPDIFRAEVCAGFDADAVARALKQRGLLAIPPSQPKGCTTQRRHPDTGKPTRFYVIKADIFEAETEKTEPEAEKEVVTVVTVVTPLLTHNKQRA